MKVPDEGNSRLEQITNIAVGQISVQFSRSVVSNSLCNPMNCSMPDFPVHHQLPELAQTHVHWVNDATWPSHSLLSSSSPAFGLAQQQGLFQWVSSSHQVAKWKFSFSICPSIEYSGLISFRLTGLISLQPRNLQESSPIPLFKSIISIELLY